jgi:IS5 family transposase
MLVDRYPAEDVFARVPELADQTDPVLRHLDALLDDDPLFQRVRADLVRRYPHTADHGRPSTPAEVILRLLVVKYLFRWSNPETERWVGDSLVLRWFCRVYFHRVPDATTLLRWEHTIQPTTLQPLLDRVVVLAQQIQVTQGRKLRLDGTVVETTIHHPTDSSLLTDGVRVLSRVIRRSKPLVSQQMAGVRGAFRSRLRHVRSLSLTELKALFPAAGLPEPAATFYELRSDVPGLLARSFPNPGDEQRIVALFAAQAERDNMGIKVWSDSGTLRYAYPVAILASTPP